MLSPKRTKYRKAHKGRIHGEAKGGTTLNFGNYGLKARVNLEQQVAALTAELGDAKAERERWERRVALLKSDRLDPDMLDERARALLGFTDPRDVVMLRKQP